MLIIILAIYCFIGIGCIISDSIQPFHNQPEYIRNKNLKRMFLMGLAWPIYSELSYSMQDKIKRLFKR